MCEASCAARQHMALDGPTSQSPFRDILERWLAASVAKMLPYGISPFENTRAATRRSRNRSA